MNDETKAFLVELFDVKLDQNKKEIIEIVNKKFDAQNKLFETKFDELRTEVTGIVGEILEVIDNRFKNERKRTDAKIKKNIAVL